MATKEVLKSYFETGDVPTQEHFAALIDSFTTPSEASDAAKGLFIELWKTAVGSNGGYNSETGFFELNGLTDITYEQALDIYENGKTSYPRPNAIGAHCRTNILMSMGYKTSSFDQYNYSIDLSNIGNGAAFAEVIRLTNSAERTVKVENSIAGIFISCFCLKKVIGTIFINNFFSSNPYDFSGCTYLEEIRFANVKSDMRFDFLASISRDSLAFLINNSANGNSSITVTVHKDVYAKIADASNSEWHSLIALAANKNIQIAQAS